MQNDPVSTGSRLSPHDIFLFNEGTHQHIQDQLGVHLDSLRGVAGAHFAVWVPNAAHVSVIGTFNHGNPQSHPLQSRRARNAPAAPVSIYELHLGSWRRDYTHGGRSLSYRELAEQLPTYVRNLGFTHVELLPVTEHPFFGSWGYQVTGYFAPSSRFGTPQDFMYLVDRLHQAGLGVVIDWVPSHFPTDVHGPGFFDGTHLYEHADPREGFHPDWNSFLFNYDRNEVRSFLLLSSARHWMERFHADGLRVDAVASMLYRDYSRKAGEWIPNAVGGRENLEAIAFLKQMNMEIQRALPDVVTIAEESTAWPMVSRPVDAGGPGVQHEVGHGLDA
jgi:1,4-alpha-glucan branching enzyme